MATDRPDVGPTSPPPHESASVVDFLDGYKHFPVPNLSGVRVPLESTDNTSVRVRHPFSNHHLFVALARCLGAYCSVQDVLLCWVVEGTQKAVRVSWDAAPSWEALQSSIAIAEFTINEVASTLSLDSTQNPYVAIVSDDLSVAHPLVIQSVDGSLNLKTSTLYFHNTGADILVNQIAAIIEHVVEKPSTSPNDLSFLPHTLQSRDDRCAHPPSYTHIKPAASVVEYVIRYSIATPNKIAVEFFPDLGALDLENVQPEEFITYAELHRRSNQFARYLIEKGVEREDRIAICSQRDVNFHIVMFGVLKAGGCYVPVRLRLNKCSQCTDALPTDRP